MWGESQAVDYLLGMKDPQDAEAFIDKKGLKYLFPALLGEVRERRSGEA